MFDNAFVLLCIASALGLLPAKLMSDFEREFGTQNLSGAVNISIISGVTVFFACAALSFWLYEWWMIFVLLLASGALAGLFRVILGAQLSLFSGFASAFALLAFLYQKGIMGV